MSSSNSFSSSVVNMPSFFWVLCSSSSTPFLSLSSLSLYSCTSFSLTPHRRIVPSIPTLTTSSPPPTKHTPMTSSQCPSNATHSFPSSSSSSVPLLHTLTPSSLPAATTNL